MKGSDPCAQCLLDPYDFLMDFENLKVKVPIGYDAFLRCHYGDYMKLPPKEEQVPHHEYKVYMR